MEIVIITGISGAGKTEALDVFEDMGYYSMDNLPPQLIKDFVTLNKKSQPSVDKIAIVMDVRGGVFFKDIIAHLEELKEQGEKVSVLFLDARDDVLVRRFKELRRKHPLEIGGSIQRGIERERLDLSEIKSVSDYIIDTSELTLGKLKHQIKSFYVKSHEAASIPVSVISFGFKHGILQEADLVFDIRFLPNPYYISELKDKTGFSDDVVKYIFQFPAANKFLSKIIDLLEFLLPLYKNEGKENIIIGIGCTGGKHRSVTMAEKIAEELSVLGEDVFVSHRDQKYWK